MNIDITVFEDTRAFCLFDIDDTPYGVTTKLVQTLDGDKILITISELGYSPVIYDLCDVAGYDPRVKITDLVEAFLCKEYRLVSLSDETVDLDAYKSKKFENRLRTTPFYIDSDKEVFKAELFKVYEGLEDVNFYRFVVTNQIGNICLAKGLNPNPELYGIGTVFEMLLREFIRVVRTSRANHKSYMDNWELTLD